MTRGQFKGRKNVFVVGMIVRLGDLMRISLSVSVNQILNYFDTFENLLILLRDFSPDIGKTFLKIDTIVNTITVFFI